MRCIHVFLHHAKWFGVLLLAALAPLASADPGGTTVLAVSGASSPEGAGEFSRFGIPVVNEAGQTAFTADLDPFTGTNIYRAVPSHQTLIAAGADDELAINGRGEIVWRSGLPEDHAIFRGDGTTTVEVARTGNQAGNIVGEIYGGNFSLPLLNDAGEVAFRTDLQGQSGQTAIYRTNGAESWRVARTGPGHGLDRLDAPTGMNNGGQVVFTAHQPGEAFDSIYSKSGAFLDLGDPLFVPGASVVAGGARIVEIRPDEHADPLIQENGRVVFGSGTSLGEDEIGFPYGVFHVNSHGHLESLILGSGSFADGEPSPFGGNWQNIEHSAVNQQGQVLLRGNTDDGNPAGFFIRDPQTPGTSILLNRADPTEPGIFTDIDGAAFSNAGHFAFSAHPAFDEGDPGERAIYMIETRPGVTDADGNLVAADAFHRVARTGDMLMGSEIVDLVFERRLASQRGLRDHPVAAATERAGVNERGQVAFWFELADGREGIALWSPSRLERVIDGDFDQQLFHWTPDGPGIAQAVELSPGQWAAELLAGSPATIAQAVDTPQLAFDLDFELRFLSQAGTLEVLLDETTIGQFDAAAYGTMETFVLESLRVDDRTGLHDAALRFRFDGPSGSGVQLDNVSLRAIPEPACLALLGLGSLVLRKRRSTA